MTTTTHITDERLTRARCGLGHGGPTTLSLTSGAREYAQCDGCGRTYSAEQVMTATRGVHGEGGIYLAARP